MNKTIIFGIGFIYYLFVGATINVVKNMNESLTLGVLINLLYVIFIGGTTTAVIWWYIYGKKLFSESGDF